MKQHYQNVRNDFHLNTWQVSTYSKNPNRPEIWSMRKESTQRVIIIYHRHVKLRSVNGIQRFYSKLFIKMFKVGQYKYLCWKMKQTYSSIGFRNIHFAGQRKTRKQSKKYKISAIWAYVTDTVSLAADHCNKVEISIKCHVDFSVSSYTYTIILIHYIIIVY